MGIRSPIRAVLRSPLRGPVKGVGGGESYGAHGFGIVMYGQSNMANMSITSASPPAAASGTSYWNGSAWITPPVGNGVRELLNTFKSLTGLDCWAVNGAITATATSGLIPGTANYIALTDLIDGAGEAPHALIVHQGEGNAESVDPSKATWKTDWNDIHTDLATHIGKSRAQFPMLVASLATADGVAPDATTATDEEWWDIQTAIKELADEQATVYFSHATTDATLVDTFHYDAASYGKMGKRYAYSLASVKGLGGAIPAWFITAATVVSDTVTRLTVAHSMGTDFTPTTGITGFEISNNNGAAYVSGTGARVDATTIDVTHSSLGTVADRLVRYQWGVDPDITAPALDNGALAAPLSLSAGQEIIADGSGASLPVANWIARQGPDGNATTQVQTFTGTTMPDTTTTNKRLHIGRWGAGALTSVVVTPYIGGVAQTDVTATLRIESSSAPRNTFHDLALPDGTTTFTTVVTHSSNPSTSSNLFFWWSDASLLSSTTPVDSEASATGTAATRTVQLSTSDGGFVLAIASVAGVSNSATWSGDGAFNERYDVVGGVDHTAADTSGTPTGTNDFEVTVTFVNSGADCRLTAISYR